MSEDKQHATYSASGAERWLACPGSIKLSENAPPEIESEYAKEGTEAHDVLAQLLNNRKKRANARQFLLRSHSAEMVKHADYVADHVEDLMEELTGSQLLVETRADYSFIEPEQFGTLDIAIVQLWGDLIIIDYKYGAGYAVDVANNKQMILYALSVADDYGYQFDRVRIQIAQPRADHPDGYIREQILTMQDLKNWIPVFKSGVAKSKLKNAPLVPGDHCRWCKAKPICPGISKKKLEEAQIDFDDESGKLALIPVNTIKVPHISNILKASELIEFWISSVRSHAYQILSSGGTIPGWKLVEKRATRKWKEPVKVSREALKKFGRETAFSIDLLSPNQLEQATKDKTFVAKHSVAISSGMTVVPEDDPRQAINQIENDFDVIDDNHERKNDNGKKTKTTGGRRNGHQGKKGRR